MHSSNTLTLKVQAKKNKKNPLKVLVMTIVALGHFKQDNYSTVGGDGGCRAGEV